MDPVVATPSSTMSTTIAARPTTLKPSISIQEESALQSLRNASLPDKELHSILGLRDTLTTSDMLDRFDVVTEKLGAWLGTAHVAVYTLEKNVKDNENIPMDTTELDAALEKLQPILYMFMQVGEIIDESGDEDDDDDFLDDETNGGKTQQRKMAAKMAMAKIQSEWSGLQHFVASVKKQIELANEERQLASAMERILLQIDDVSLLIFQYHERKQAALASTASSLSSTETMPSPSLSLSSDTRSQQSEEDLLVEIDQRVEPVFNEIERIYARMMSDDPPQDKHGTLKRKHSMVQGRWESLRSEIDDLKYGLKEDRWLTVFKQVADQVDVMMDGLEKTSAQCYAVINQIRDWQASSSSSTGTTMQQQQSSEMLPKSALRNATKVYGTNVSLSPSSSTGSAGYNNPQQPPVDHHKFRSVEKNFEAKYKYYTPSIDRMLAMLGSGISARVGRDNSTLRRHQSMLQRWASLKAEMDDLRLRHLPDTERMLVGQSDRPISPAWSRLSDRSDRSVGSWKDNRYRSPEPSSHDYFDPIAPLGRSKSPLSNSVTRPVYSRTGSPMGMYDETRRGRSATPNSAGGGREMWRSMNQAGSPSSGGTYGRLQRTVSPLSFGSLLRSSSSDTSSVSSASLPRPTTAMTTQRKSKTPERPAWNSSVKTERSDFSTLDPLWKSEEKATTATTTTRRKSMVPSVNEPAKDDRASWMKPTKSTLARRQAQQSAEEAKRDLPPRSKTPNPTSQGLRSTTLTRPKSSMDRHHHGDSLVPLPVNYPNRERAMSPVRRAGTPSLIPRPKTPSSGGRVASPGLVPRPRSSMQHRSPQAATAAAHMLQVLPYQKQ